MNEGNRDYVGEALKRVSSSPAAVTSTARFNGGDDPALGDNTAAQQPAWKIGSFSAKELQSMIFPPLSSIVPDIIPAAGVTLLCSKPKFGKSWLAYDLSIACTTERYTLGTIKPAQGNVLYLALEDSKRRLQWRRRSCCLRSVHSGLTSSFSRRSGAACTKVALKISEIGISTRGPR